MKPSFQAVNETSIVIADDHPLVIAGVRAALPQDFQVLAEARNGFEAIRMVKLFKPEILLMDLEMGCSSAEETIARCLASKPDLKIAILSVHVEARYLRPLRDLEIRAFIHKDEAPESVLQALRVVKEGGTWFSHIFARQLAAITRVEPLAPDLTPREREILGLMLIGKTNQAVAEELCLSKQTVRRYTTVIYEKLGVSSRIEAIVKCSPG